jgi:hypothetical protein
VQIIVFCGRKKDRGNDLYARGKFDFALKRFNEGLQALKTFRGDQTDAQTAAISALNVALLSNSAAALMGKKVLVTPPDPLSCCILAICCPTAS